MRMESVSRLLSGQDPEAIRAGLRAAREGLRSEDSRSQDPLATGSRELLAALERLSAHPDPGVGAELAVLLDCLGGEVPWDNPVLDLPPPADPCPMKPAAVRSVGDLRAGRSQWWALAAIGVLVLALVFRLQPARDRGQAPGSPDRARMAVTREITPRPPANLARPAPRIVLPESPGRDLLDLTGPGILFPRTRALPMDPLVPAGLAPFEAARPLPRLPEEPVLPPDQPGPWVPDPSEPAGPLSRLLEDLEDPAEAPGSPRDPPLPPGPWIRHPE